MNDAEFREQYKPLQVPSAFHNTHTLRDQVIFALAQIGEGSANQVVKYLEQLQHDAPHKELIAGVHEILTSFYEKGLISGNENDSRLVYNLHKITRANDGEVDPNLLAPGLD